MNETLMQIGLSLAELLLYRWL